MPGFKRSAGASPSQPPHKPVAKARPSPSVLHKALPFAFRHGARQNRGQQGSRAAGRGISFHCGTQAGRWRTQTVRAWFVNSSSRGYQGTRANVWNNRPGIPATSTKGPTHPDDSSGARWLPKQVMGSYGEPFVLEPNMIYAVMGALDLAGYRSSKLYLEAAKGCT